MKVKIITFATEKYAAAAEYLCATARGIPGVDDVVVWDFDSLRSVDSSFYDANREILSQERGAGYWLWKPKIILETLRATAEDTIVLYMDAGDGFIFPDAYELATGIETALSDSDIYLTTGGFANGVYTKRDCFYLMNCDQPEYYNRIQMEAGIILVRNTDSSFAFISQWLQWCKNSAVLTDEPNICGMPNLPKFIDHRHDQSILTNLAIQKNVKCGSILRKYIKCNIL